MLVNSPYSFVGGFVKLPGEKEFKAIVVKFRGTQVGWYGRNPKANNRLMPCFSRPVPVEVKFDCQDFYKDLRRASGQVYFF